MLKYLVNSLDHIYIYTHIWFNIYICYIHTYIYKLQVPRFNSLHNINFYCSGDISRFCLFSSLNASLTSKNLFAYFTYFSWYLISPAISKTLTIFTFGNSTCPLCLIQITYSNRTYLLKAEKATATTITKSVWKGSLF